MERQRVKVWLQKAYESLGKVVFLNFYLQKDFHFVHISILERQRGDVTLAPVDCSLP